MLQSTLTVDEAAKFLKRSPRTIRGWIVSGRIRACKVGRSYVIPEAEVRRNEVREYDPDRPRRIAELRAALSGFSMEKYEAYCQRK